MSLWQASVYVTWLLCVCVYVPEYLRVSPHLQLVTMEIGQAGGTRGKSRSMWFDWATHTAALVTHTCRHTYTWLTSDDDVYWWWRVPGSHSESRHESIKLPDPGLAGVSKPEPELVVQTDMKDIFYVRWGSTGPHTDSMCVCCTCGLLTSGNCPNSRSWLLWGSVKGLKSKKSFLQVLKHP